MGDQTSLADHELLRLLRAGDEGAFAALYRRRQGGLYRFALQMSGSTAVAEEVTQELFLVVMKDASNYDPQRGSVAAWLYGIARKLVLQFMERNQAHESLDVDESVDDARLARHSLTPDPAGDLVRRQTIDSVRRAVLNLPERYREAVVLCDLQEVSYAEAAVALDCSIGTVRSRLHRGRALLMEKLQALELRDGKTLLGKPARCMS